MSLLKEKSKYVPTAVEKALAWVLTLGSAAALAVHIFRSLRG